LGSIKLGKIDQKLEFHKKVKERHSFCRDSVKVVGWWRRADCNYLVVKCKKEGSTFWPENTMLTRNHQIEYLIFQILICSLKSQQQQHNFCFEKHHRLLGTLCYCVVPSTLSVLCSYRHLFSTIKTFEDIW